MDFTALLGPVMTVLSVVGGSAILAAILPRPAPGSPLGAVFLLLDALAANWLKARNIPPVAVCLLAAGLVLSACATTPQRQAEAVAAARVAYSMAHPFAASYAVRPDTDPAVRLAIQAADAAVLDALAAWSAAPAEDARAQALDAAMAALLRLLVEAGAAAPELLQAART